MYYVPHIAHPSIPPRWLCSLFHPMSNQISDEILVSHDTDGAYTQSKDKRYLIVWYIDVVKSSSRWPQTTGRTRTKHVKLYGQCHMLFSINQHNQWFKFTRFVQHWYSFSSPRHRVKHCPSIDTTKASLAKKKKASPLPLP